jgi:hypothetical protein
MPVELSRGEAMQGRKAWLDKARPRQIGKERQGR